MKLNEAPYTLGRITDDASIEQVYETVRQGSDNDGDNQVLSKIELISKTAYSHKNENVLNSFKRTETEFVHSRMKNEALYRTKNVLLVGTGTVGRMPILKNLAQFRFSRFVCLSREKTWAHGLQLFDDWIYAEHESIASFELTLAQVERYMQESGAGFKFDAILTYDDFCVDIAFHLANYFQLPSTPVHLMACLRDKYEFRKVCAELNIPTPRFCVIESEERERMVWEIEAGGRTSLMSANSEAIVFPVIIKNRRGVGKGKFYSGYFRKK